MNITIKGQKQALQLMPLYKKWFHYSKGRYSDHYYTQVKAINDWLMVRSRPFNNYVTLIRHPALSATRKCLFYVHFYYVTKSKPHTCVISFANGP